MRIKSFNHYPYQPYSLTRPRLFKIGYKMRHAMEQVGHGPVFGTIATIVLFFISHFTLSDGAALAAIFAGLTTGGYNIYKFYKDKNNGNPKPKKR